MAEEGKPAIIKIELTPEQREQIKRALGREGLELGIIPEVLEVRVAPRAPSPGGTGN